MRVVMERSSALHFCWCHLTTGCVCHRIVRRMRAEVLTCVGCGERSERVIVEERWLRGTACWWYKCLSLSVAGCVECS